MKGVEFVNEEAWVKQRDARTGPALEVLLGAREPHRAVDDGLHAQVGEHVGDGKLGLSNGQQEARRRRALEQQKRLPTR